MIVWQTPANMRGFLGAFIGPKSTTVGEFISVARKSAFFPTYIDLEIAAAPFQQWGEKLFDYHVISAAAVIAQVYEIRYTSSVETG